MKFREIWQHVTSTLCFYGMGLTICILPFMMGYGIVLLFHALAILLENLP